MFLKDINAVRKIEWGRTHLWDIQFNDPSLSKFSAWFPATNVEEGLVSLNSYGFEASVNSYSIPKSKGLETIRITFLDNVDFIVHNWLLHWIETTIFNNGDYVSRLSDTGVLKTVTIKRVDNMHRDVSGEMGIRSYLVYPQGALNYTGDSDGNVVSNAIDFVIASKIKGSNILTGESAFLQDFETSI